MRLTREKAIKRIENNGGNVTPKKHLIAFSKDARIGLKIWSAIDYLTNHEGFNFIRVGE
jgi:hypothetical protein